MEYINQIWQENANIVIEIGYQVALILLVLIASYFIAKMVRNSVLRSNRKAQRLDETLVPVFCAIANYSVYAIGLIIILDVIGVNTNSIIALLGAAGLAVGLALKDTLSNIAAGIMLLILRPFSVKHFIECGSFMGTVKEIGLFTTTLDTTDGLYLTMPNSTLWGAPIKNFSRNGKRRMDLVVGIAYGDSIDKGLQVLTEITSNEKRFLQDPAPQVMVQALADSSVILQLRAWVSVDDYWKVVWENNKMIKEKIEMAGLTIPFPQRDVYVRDVRAALAENLH